MSRDGPIVTSTGPGDKFAESIRLNFAYWVQRRLRQKIPMMAGNFADRPTLSAMASSRHLASSIARITLGGAMVAAGVAHLTVQRREFQAQVPAWFPVDDDLTVLASGVVEIALGGAFVALPRHRRTIGALLAGFFVAIFPGNLGQYLEGTDAFGLDTDGKRLGRLFFQPLLVLWALWGGGWLRRRRSTRTGGGPALSR
jgi:uncharacterized membrane protein